MHSWENLKEQGHAWFKKEELNPGRVEPICRIAHLLLPDGRSIFWFFAADEVVPDLSYCREVYSISAAGHYPDRPEPFLFSIHEGNHLVAGWPMTQQGVKFFRDEFQPMVMEKLGPDTEVAIYINGRGAEMNYIRDVHGEKDITNWLASLPER